MTYIDLAIRRQVILERLKSAENEKFQKTLRRLNRLIRDAFFELDGDISESSRTNLNNFIRQLSLDQAKIYSEATENFINESVPKISPVTAAQEIIDLEKTIALGSTKLKTIKNRTLVNRVLARPVTNSGKLLDPWLQEFTDAEINRLNGVVRAGHAQGKTNSEIVREIIGTKSRNFRDGMLNTTRRNAETIVRTSVQHAASSARQEVYENNTDVVEKYEWLSTLDSDTSRLCRTLDGQQFEHGQGPVPPLHPRCRSTTLPVLSDEFDFLSVGRTRSSADGPVSANTSYYEWLKRQTKAEQLEILGPAQTKLFRDGGLSATEFSRLQLDKNFQPLTLEEMRQKEPAAFERAGL